MSEHPEMGNVELAEYYIRLSGKRRHMSDCSTSVAPAERPSPCDCEAPEDDEDWPK